MTGRRKHAGTVQKEGSKGAVAVRSELRLEVAAVVSVTQLRSFGIFGTCFSQGKIWRLAGKIMGCDVGKRNLCTCGLQIDGWRPRRSLLAAYLHQVLAALH